MNINLRGRRGLSRSWARLPLSILVFTLAMSSPSYAIDYGIDTLALARMDPKVIVSQLPAGWSIGLLEHTFGDPLPNLEAIAKSGKLGGFRVHLRNGTCYRNHVCETVEPKLNDVAQLSKDAAKYEAFHKRYPNVKCYISHTLEHDEKNAAVVQKWIDTVRAAAPSCLVVNSAFTGASGSGALNEKHGNTVKADLVSNDGQSLFDSNSAAYRQNGKLLVLGWFPRMNGRTTGEKVFTPPSKRVAWPMRADFQQALRVLQPPQSKPAGKPAACKTVKSWGPGELYKPNAEDYNSGGGRENKPMFILRSKSAQFDLLTAAGVKVGCAKYYGPYVTPGLYRSYVGNCSGDSAVSLMDKAKSEWLYLRDGGTCLLTNTVRRQGYYR